MKHRPEQMHIEIINHRSHHECGDDSADSDNGEKTTHLLPGHEEQHDAENNTGEVRDDSDELEPTNLPERSY